MKLTKQSLKKGEGHHLASEKFTPKNIPLEMTQLDRWVGCYVVGENSSTSPKRPIGGPKDRSSQRSLADLKIDHEQHQHFGFCLSDEDPYVITDVDNLPKNFGFYDLPAAVQNLLAEFPSYAEISPSGQGLHIIHRTDKNLLSHLDSKTSSVEGFEGTLYIKNQFLTFTGHVFDEFTQINSIEAPKLQKRLLARGASKVIHHPRAHLDQPVGLAHTEDINLTKLVDWLYKIPTSVTDTPHVAALQRAYSLFNPPILPEGLDDYEHWRVVASALRHGTAHLTQADVDQAAEEFAMWSLQDVNHASPTQHQEAIQKFYDCPPTRDGITYKTLAMLSNCLTPNWPYPKLDKDGKPTNKPLPHIIANWEELWKHGGIGVEQNEITNLYRLTGPDQLLRLYFASGQETASRAQIEGQVLYHGQCCGMPAAGPTHSNAAAKHLLTARVLKYNPITRWIDQAPPLPEDHPSWFQALWEKIELQDQAVKHEELYRSLFKKNLMGLIRGHYYVGPYSGSTGIVILQGPQSAHKSTFIRGLMPQEMGQDYVGTTQIELHKSKIEELQKQAGQFQHLIFDEVESFLKAGNAKTKAFLSQSYDLVRELYVNQHMQKPRTCIFWGSTNAVNVPITDDGSRRIQIIPVKSTAPLRKFPIVKVYQELLEEYQAFVGTEEERAFLWVLTKDEISQNEKINTREHRIDTSAMDSIKDLWDFSTDWNPEDYLTDRGAVSSKDPRRWSLLKIRKYIKDQGGLAGPGLKYDLARIVGTWNNSLEADYIIGNGVVSKGRFTEVKRNRFWLMPYTFEQLEMRQLKENKDEDLR